MVIFDTITGVTLSVVSAYTSSSYSVCETALSVVVPTLSPVIMPVFESTLATVSSSTDQFTPVNPLSVVVDTFGALLSFPTETL